MLFGYLADEHAAVADAIRTVIYIFSEPTQGGERMLMNCSLWDQEEWTKW
jgi:hypothetical protein